MKVKRRRKRLHPILNIIPIMLFAAAAVFFADGISKLEFIEIPVFEATSPSPTVGVGRGFSGLELFSSNAILFDPESGEIFYGKDCEQRIYPASMTKIMTSLAAIEQIDDLDAPFTLQYSDYAGLYEQNAAMAGFSLGETVTIRDILYATMLPSGAEAATALARAAAGSLEEFVPLMNQRAAEIGMDNTHFANVTGLHDDNHYTTASDMALLLSEAFKNEHFMEVYRTLYYTTTPTAQHPNGLKLTSTLVPRLKQLERERVPIIGNKTGYTLEAQLCLASIAETNGKYRAVISVGAEGDGRSRPTHLEDAYLLYQKAFKN